MKHSEENHMVIPGPWTGNPNDPNAPEAVEPTAEEKREEESRKARATAAAELADGFSQVAEFIENHPDMVMPYGSVYVRANSRAEFLAAIRNLKDAGKVEIRVTGGSYPECVAKRKFGAAEINVYTDLKNATDAAPVPAPDLCREVRMLMEEQA